MEGSVLSRIGALQKMSVPQLREQWLQLFGSPPTSTNRQHLWKRLCWELQARAHGGLSDAAEARLDGLGEDAWNRATSRRQRAHGADTDAAREPAAGVAPFRDFSMPAPGTVISKTYKGHELTVVVREDGFEFDGGMFGSLTAIAKHVTGSHSINGKLFWGISRRDRRR